MTIDPTQNISLDIAFIIVVFAVAACWRFFNILNNKANLDDLYKLRSDMEENYKLLDSKLDSKLDRVDDKVDKIRNALHELRNDLQRISVFASLKDLKPE